MSTSDSNKWLDWWSIVYTLKPSRSSERISWFFYEQRIKSPVQSTFLEQQENAAVCFTSRATQSSPGAWAAAQETSKKASKPSFSSRARNPGLKARTHYTGDHIQLQRQPPRRDDTHLVRLSLEPSMLINTLSNAYLWVTIYSPWLPSGSLN